MISLIFLLSALLLGVALTRRLGHSLTFFEAPSLAAVLGLVVWTWTSFLAALLLPYAAALSLTVLVATCATVWLWRTSPAWTWHEIPGDQPTRLAWTAFTFLTTLLFASLMWTHDLPKAADGAIYSANSTWADFGLHASLITHFAAGGSLPLDFPVASGTHLTYPFMVDLLSGWLVYGGWSLHAALFIPSLLLAVAFLQLMIGFSLRLFGRIGGSLIGLTLALFSGSAVGIFTAYSDFRTSGLTLSQFLARLPKDYTALSTPNAQVTNFIADLLLPQRAFLMGAAAFAAVMVLVMLLRQRYSRRLAIFTGVLVGLLPLIHAHTFVITAALLIGLCGEAWLIHKKFFNTWINVGLTALFVALPQLLWQSFANGTGTGGHLALGWTIAPGESWLLFWVHNFGLMGLAIVNLVALFLIKTRFRKFLPWFLPLIVVFITANIYSLQPFAYDNLKLIMYVFLFVDLFLGYGAVWLICQRKSYVLPVALAAVLLCGSGALAVMREFQHADQFASPDDIALADWAESATAPSDIFLTTDRPNQPLATLAGRSIVVGYRGWLYNYNFDYQPRLTAVAQAFQGKLPPGNPYHAEYLAVAAYEPPEWTVNTSAIQSAYTQVYSNPSWTVYRLP
ncbi:MAG: hypothetical protein NVS3B29_03460 [Candidatus Saccharimonadales bacterium]